MKTQDAVTKAQVLAGIGNFEGNSVEINQMAVSLAVFHQTLNAINNDPKLTLIQEMRDYQASPDPYPIADAYPLPLGCRRVIKAIAGTVELRKTDFSEIIRSRECPGMINVYAINAGSIHLAYPSKIVIVYAKEFREFMPQEELDLPAESIDYLINLAAYNLALSFNTERIKACQTLAEKSYNALLGNLSVNSGEKYQNIYVSLNRFGRGPWL